MTIIQYNVNTPGLQDINPRLVQMITTDNLATITAAGYMNKQGQVLQGESLIPTDVMHVIYSYNTTTHAGTFAILTPTIAANGTITLVAWVNSGDVLLPVTSGDFAVFNGTSGQIKDAGYSPTNAAKTKVVMANGATVANHIATYVDTAGTVGEDAATAINGGNIQAGLSGTAGTVASFPTTASKGSLILKAVANTGNTNTTISNVAMGQASVISIPDPGTATADFAVAPAALVNGNLISANGTAGLIQDGGIATTNIVVKNAANTFSGTGSIILPKVNGTEAANAVTASGVAGVITTSALTTAGGASYAITWTNTVVTTTSVILLTIAGGTNTTENITLKCVPGSSSATLTIYNNTAATALNGTILISYLVM